MTMQELKIFEEKQIRTVWDEVQEKWYFCVPDIISVLTDSVDVRQYIKRLRQRDPELNSVWGTICTPHQFLSTDGKRHAVNCASMEGVFRIIQSIPSPKAEPIKRWLAEVGAERIKQMQDPELGIQQYLMDYKRLGFFATLVQPYLFVFIVIASFLRRSFPKESYILKLLSKRIIFSNQQNIIFEL